MAEDIVRSLTIRSSVEGSDQSVRALQSLDQQQSAVAKSALEMAKASDTASQAQLSAARRFDAIRAAVDPAFQAQQRFAKGQADVTKALQLGVVNAAEHATVLEQLARKYVTTTAAQNDNTKAVGLSTMQFQVLSGAARRGFDAIAAGSSPFRALTMEAGHLTAAIGEEGIGGLFADLGAAARSFITPTTAVVAGFGAIGAAAVLAGKAGLDYAAGQDSLTKSLFGMGRQSDATVASLTSLAEKSAAAGHVSISAARDMAGAYAHTGQIGSDTIGSLIGITAQFAHTTGTTVPDATTKLAAAFADPVKGAEDLNKTLGFLSGSQLNLIRELDASGQHAAAQTALLNAMRPALADLTAGTNGWAVAWNAVKNAASDAYDVTGKLIYSLGRVPTLQEKIVTEANKPKSAPWWSGLGADEMGHTSGITGRDDDALSYMQEDARRQGAGSMSAYRSSYGSQKSLEASKVIDQMTPTSADILNLTKWETALKEALAVGNAPSGTEAALKRVKELLAAGGTDAYALGRAAKDAFDVAPLMPYERAITQVEQKYRELVKAAGTNQSAISGLNKAKADELATIRFDAINGPIRDGTLRINEQVAALKIQRDGFMASTEVQATMAAKQDLVNQYARQGITVQGDLAKQVDTLAAASGKAAAANENLQRTQQNIIGGMDELRSGTQSGLTGVFSDVRQGKNPLQSLVSNLGKQADQFFDRTVSKPLTESLFGFAGKPGGGLFGDAASKAFGSVSGTKIPDALSTSAMTTASMTVSAASVVVNGGVGVGAGAGAPALPAAGGAGGAGSSTAWPVGKVDTLPLGLPGSPSASDPAAMSRYAQAIKDVESSGGNYSAIGPTTKAGDNAYGAYQVMGANIPSWTKSATGTSMSPTEFLNNKAAQDAVFNDQFGKSVAKYGNPQDAASVWFTGKPMASAGNVSDVLGTTAPGYVQKFNDALGKVPDAASSASSGLGSFARNLDQFGNALGKTSGGGSGGGLGSLFGGGGSGFDIDPLETWSANGNIMTSRGPMTLNRYANGGIATSPQVSIFGEGRGPEAYVPLPDGRSIPVSMKMPAAPAANSNVAGPTVVHAPLTVVNHISANGDGQVAKIANDASRNAVGQHQRQLQRNLPSMLDRSTQRYAAGRSR